MMRTRGVPQTCRLQPVRAVLARGQMENKIPRGNSQKSDKNGDVQVHY